MFNFHSYELLCVLTLICCRLMALWNAIGFFSIFIYGIVVISWIAALRGLLWTPFSHEAIWKPWKKNFLSLSFQWNGKPLEGEEKTTSILRDVCVLSLLLPVFFVLTTCGNGVFALFTILLSPNPSVIMR